MKMGEKGVPDMTDWLTSNFSSSQVVAVDPFLITASSSKALEKKFESKGIVLLPLLSNPIDTIWADARPSPPSSQIKIHSVEYAGDTFQSKISKVQEQMKEAGVIAVVVSMLDEVSRYAVLSHLLSSFYYHELDSMAF